ncbi:MAG: VacJ family lipoprotein [Methylomonas sp.]
MQRNKLLGKIMFKGSPLEKNKVKISNTLLVSVVLLASGCASTEENVKSTEVAVPVVKAAEEVKHDPYEGFNRSMYDFNMAVDKTLLKPVANGYKAVTPVFVQSRVSNFFTNLKGINVVINDLLQGKFKQSASDAGRFTTNSTIGLLGLFDVASDFGFESNVEDFGQTLAVWGVDQGPYLVLPLFGPTTLRDGTAIVFDKAANPGTYVPGSGIVEGISDRANAEGALNFIDEAALDPYVFMRESFLQYRTSLVNDGKTDSSAYDEDLDVALAGSSKSTKPGELNNKIKSSMDLNGSNNTLKAFNEMSTSFEEAEAKFKSASDKLDKIANKQKRLKRK